MFSLIITIISIALVAALALATIYYGGSAFNKGTDNAKAAQLINEGQQINGAFALAKSDATVAGTTAPADLVALTTATPSPYLAQVPAHWTVGTGAFAGVAVNTDASVTAGVCAAVNAKGGSATLAGGQYGCDSTTTAGVNTVFYKY